MSLSRKDLKKAKTDPMVYLRPYIVDATLAFSGHKLDPVRESGESLKYADDLDLKGLCFDLKRLTSSCDSLQRFSHSNEMLSAMSSPSIKVMIEDVQAAIGALDNNIKTIQGILQEEFARQGIEETKRGILQADSVRRYGIQSFLP